MRKHHLTWAFQLLVGTLFLFVAGCSQQEILDPAQRSVSDSQAKKSSEKTFYGPATPLGKGVARAWVMVNSEGEPTSVGVNMSVKAVENLGDEPKVFILRLPKQGDLTLYNYIMMDWNPQGHPPVGTYTVPHFDLHFYMISEEATRAIPGMAPFGPGGIQFDTPVPPQYVPFNYMQDPGIVPMMGVHWADRNSPEYTGSSFSRTFILGSLGGEFIFHEPMFTVAYLMGLPGMPDQTIPIPQALAYQKSGYYPQNYSFSYSATPKEYTIALTDLQYKTAQ